MSVIRTFEVSIGTSNASSLSGGTIRAQVVDSTGASVGSPVSSGFVNMGQGLGLWHTTTISDGQRGGVKFYDVADSTVVFQFTAINPEGIAENTDVKTSTVAGASAETIAAAVWNYLTSAATTVGSLGKRIVDYLTGDTYGRIGAPAGASISADIAAAQVSLNTLLSRLSSSRALLLDNIDAAISSRLASAGYTAPPSASAVASAVWSAVTRTLTSGAAITADDIAAIADAVCDEILSGHTTDGSLGATIAAIATETGIATGAITVDSDYDVDGSGDPDQMTFVNGSASNPVSNGIVRAYLTSEYDAGTYNVKQVRRTDAAGRIVSPFRLAAGDYTFVFSTPGDEEELVMEVPVAA